MPATKGLEGGVREGARSSHTEAPAGRQSPIDKLRPASTPQGECLISTDGLVKAYGAQRPVLNDVCVTIREGETVALIGANGAGKSTLLKTLVGLHDLDAGSVTIFGERFTRRPGRSQKAVIRSQIGFVFQNHGLVRRLSALSNVVHGKLGLKGGWRAWHDAIAPQSWRDEATAALEALGLSNKALSRADQLSGGQAQRVAIARALVRKPRLFIADEPAASLDPAAGHDVMRAFADIAEQTGTTLVYTTHDMEHALSYARRVIALKDGRVFLDAQSRDLSKRDLEKVFHGC